MHIINLVAKYFHCIGDHRHASLKMCVSYRKLCAQDMGVNNVCQPDAFQGFRLPWGADPVMHDTPWIPACFLESKHASLQIGGEQRVCACNVCLVHRWWL